MIKLAALDIAGTTVNDHGGVYEALLRSVEETGAQVKPADLQRWMGTSKPEAIRQLMHLGGVEPTVDLVHKQFQRFRELLQEIYAAAPPVPIDGAAQAIASLRAAGIKVALTTGFDNDVATTVLNALGWTVGPDAANTVDALVTAEQVSAGRPAPYLIFHAMEETGIQEVSQVVAVGDTSVDLGAAHAAGVLGVGVLTGKADSSLLEAQPHAALLNSVADLPEFLTSLESRQP